MIDGKTILITGSATGIGEAMARLFHAAGARVVIHGKDPSEVHRVASDLGDRVLERSDDLSDPESPQNLIDATVNAFGGIDALVNNAAVITRKDLDKSDANLFDHDFSVNTRAPLFLIKSALPYLSKAKGNVLNIGSINSYCGERNLLIYSMTKGALLTMTRNLGDTLHRENGVCVNQFNLGWVLSPNEIKAKIAEGLSADWPDKVPANLAPCGRILLPEEIAKIALPWVSGETRPVSGSIIDIEQFPVIGRNPVKE
ncbi:MAG: SDR family oxidoreductase [Verrucomicrobia bacterium]|jgi:NAD(P)-dependent dehydrogenase (short-subunit alcohol dehydrogenase family)|nr:SDR family oxidoreductase [Verrucomicrobiota bacterium]MDA0724501.1 SDR family oxidoreductase [Verrucomicrobiota bacterium]MDA1045308.1 SDR family oxidoreductase [Verrucomicrobiota bacterium]